MLWFFVFIILAFCSSPAIQEIATHLVMPNFKIAPHVQASLLLLITLIHLRRTKLQTN